MGTVHFQRHSALSIFARGDERVPWHSDIYLSDSKQGRLPEPLLILVSIVAGTLLCPSAEKYLLAEVLALEVLRVQCLSPANTAYEVVWSESTVKVIQIRLKTLSEGLYALLDVKSIHRMGVFRRASKRKN